MRNVHNLNLLIMPNIAEVANGLDKAQDSTALKKWAKE